MNSNPVRRLFGLIGVAILFCQPMAYGAGLKEIYELAVNNDPQLAAAQASFMARKEVAKQGLAGLLPTASISASTSDNKQHVPPEPPTPGVTNYFNSNGFQAVVTQPLFRWDRWFQFQQSKNIEAQAAAQFAADQQNLIVRSAEAYFNILEAQDRLTSSNAEKEAVQRQLEQVQQRFDVGLVAITDVLESTAAYDSTTVNVIEAEGAQAITFENLLRLTNQNIREVNGLSQEFPVVYPEPRDEEAWANMALQNNYDIQASREALESARAQVQISKAAHYPSVEAQLSYSESATGGFAFSRQSENTTASLRLNLPVYAGGGNRSRVRESGYRLSEAQSNLDLTQRTVVENVRSLYSAINTDVARVQARLRGIESSQSALDATQTGYEVGTRNIVDVLLAQQRLYLAQFQYASAKYLYIKDTLRLKQLVGSLSPTDIYDLDQYVEQNNIVTKIIPSAR